MKIVTLCAWAGFCIPYTASAQCLQTPTAYNEPSQRVDQGVQRVAHRSGCFVDVDLALYGSRRTAALRGTYAPRDALARMVQPAGLVVTKRTYGEGYRLISLGQKTNHDASHVAPVAKRNGSRQQCETRIHQRAAMIDQLIDAAVAAGRLASEMAVQLHQQVGRVQVEAGHAGRTQSGLSNEQTSGFEKTLARIETGVP